MSKSNQAFLLQAFREMTRIRAFEESCFALSTKRPAEIAGSIHLCAGQEAVPVGALAALRDDDQIVATYRGHGWALQSGIGRQELFAEICHKQEGINGGRAGSALVMAPLHRFLGENSIVGAGGPIACGAALAALAENRGRLVLVSFGDGATSQGALHEAFVFAVSRKLPVLFVCENNGWSEMTAIDNIVPVNRLALRAAGYGLRGATIDGTDPLIVRDSVALAAQSIRAGEGPVFLECNVPRLWGHYNGDGEHYRPKADRAQAEARDPIILLERRLIADELASAGELDAIRRESRLEMVELEEAKQHWTEPSRSTATCASQEAIPEADGPAAPKLAYANGTSFAGLSGVNHFKKLTYVQAVNEALRLELAGRPEMVVYGEDVGKAGGIFGATRYLQRDFGADRVFDTPIAESAILGSAVGAAICGLRPVVEIMWGDFLLVALDQLINQAANVRYITGGLSGAPLVVRTQQGATPGSCAQHSQCLEAILAHIPGLKVGLPSTPQDAFSMLRAAVADDDPCIVIESRAFYQTKGDVWLDVPVEPVGKAAVRRVGKDVALIGWGTIMPKVLKAAELLAGEGIEAYVLDLRWLSPLDDEALFAALRATGGRVVVAHEANRTGGFGAEIVARLTERQDGPAIRVKRVALGDTRVPASPALQARLLPNETTIVEAAKGLLMNARLAASGGR